MPKAMSSLILMIVFQVILSACSTMSEPMIKKAMLSNDKLCKLDIIKVNVSAINGLNVNDTDINRISAKINDTVSHRKKKIICNNQQTKREYQIDVNIFEYDAGNRLARFLASGVGAMSFFTEVKVKNNQSQDTELADFALLEVFDSTFFEHLVGKGWVGGVAGIEFLEQEAAEKIADIIVTEERNAEAGT